MNSSAIMRHKLETKKLTITWIEVPTAAMPFLNLWLMTESWWSRYLITKCIVWDVGTIARTWVLNSGLRFCGSKTMALGFSNWQTKHWVGWVAYFWQILQKIWPQLVKPYLKVCYLIISYMHRLRCTHDGLMLQPFSVIDFQILSLGLQDIAKTIQTIWN